MLRSTVYSLLTLACLCSGVAAQEAPPDETVDFFSKNPFEAHIASNDCVSVGLDGSVIEDDPLPVGGDRWLECHTSGPVFRSTMAFLSSANEEWCVLGEVSSYRTSGDSRLDIEVTETSTDAPWALRATTAGEPFDVSTASFLGARAWPVLVYAQYSPISVQPNPDSSSCDELFGL